jgi:hypothetical protein
MVLALAQENARRNELAAEEGVSLRKLEWSTQASGAGGLGDVACADVVVASECVHYALDVGHKLRGKDVATEEASSGRWDALVATAARMLRHDGCFLLCARLRGRKDSAWDAAARTLQVCSVCVPSYENAFMDLE